MRSRPANVGADRPASLPGLAWAVGAPLVTVTDTATPTANGPVMARQDRPMPVSVVRICGQPDFAVLHRPSMGTPDGMG
jgi:hypothetical protein